MMPTPTMVDLTSTAAAQANLRRSALAMCAMQNDASKAQFLRRFDNWKQMVDAGIWPNTNPPCPPMAFVPTEFAPGWYCAEPGTEPVCAMPPIPKDRSKPAPVQVGPWGNATDETFVQLGLTGAH